MFPFLFLLLYKYCLKVTDTEECPDDYKEISSFADIPVNREKTEIFLINDAETEVTLRTSSNLINIIGTKQSCIKIPYNYLQGNHSFSFVDVNIYIDMEDSKNNFLYIDDIYMQGTDVSFSRKGKFFLVASGIQSDAFSLSSFYLISTNIAYLTNLNEKNPKNNFFLNLIGEKPIVCVDIQSSNVKMGAFYDTFTLTFSNNLTVKMFSEKTANLTVFASGGYYSTLDIKRTVDKMFNFNILITVAENQTLIINCEDNVIAYPTISVNLFNANTRLNGNIANISLSLYLNSTMEFNKKTLHLSNLVLVESNLSIINEPENFVITTNVLNISGDTNIYPLESNRTFNTRFLNLNECHTLTSIGNVNVSKSTWIKTSSIKCNSLGLRNLTYFEYDFDVPCCIEADKIEYRGELAYAVRGNKTIPSMEEQEVMVKQNAVIPFIRTKDKSLKSFIHLPQATSSEDLYLSTNSRVVTLDTRKINGSYVRGLFIQGYMSKSSLNFCISDNISICPKNETFLAADNVSNWESFLQSETIYVGFNVYSSFEDDSVIHLPVRTKGYSINIDITGKSIDMPKVVIDAQRTSQYNLCIQRVHASFTNNYCSPNVTLFFPSTAIKLSKLKFEGLIECTINITNSLITTKNTIIKCLSKHFFNGLIIGNDNVTIQSKFEKGTLKDYKVLTLIPIGKSNITCSVLKNTTKAKDIKINGAKTDQINLIFDKSFESYFGYSLISIATKTPLSIITESSYIPLSFIKTGTVKISDHFRTFCPIRIYFPPQKISIPTEISSECISSICFIKPTIKSKFVATYVDINSNYNVGLIDPSLTGNLELDNVFIEGEVEIVKGNITFSMVSLSDATIDLPNKSFLIIAAGFDIVKPPKSLHISVNESKVLNLKFYGSNNPKYWVDSLVIDTPNNYKGEVKVEGHKIMVKLNENEKSKMKKETIIIIATTVPIGAILIISIIVILVVRRKNNEKHNKKIEVISQTLINNEGQ